MVETEIRSLETNLENYISDLANEFRHDGLKDKIILQITKFACDMCNLGMILGD